MRDVCARVLTLSLLAGSGCLTLKAEHDDLAARVVKLEKRVTEQDQRLQDTLTRAETQQNELQTKLTQAEALLGRNQADVGVRVDVLQQEIQQLRGAAENADYRATAVSQNLQELRADLDGRTKALEAKLNEATQIPEGKDELLAEAESQLKRKNYKQSRRMLRTYESRYPGDARLPEIRFKIGLTYYSERDYKSGLGEFYRVIQEAKDSSIVPDALYYSGLSFAKLGQCKNSLAYFDAILKPKTKAPEQYKKAAKEQVDILKKDKGDICTDGNDVGAGSAAKQTMESKRRAP